jgi:hypothetical protein
MIQPDENQIANRSYLIWEKEGRPDGKALDHWLRAQDELAAEAASRTKSEKPKRTGVSTSKKAKGTLRAKKPKAEDVH